MIRSMEPQDVPAMVEVAVAAGLFPREAAAFLEGHAQSWFEGGRAPGAWIVDEAAGELLGVAFFEPRDATDRCWYLTMIAVSPRAQGQGRGSALVHHVEHELRSRDARLLLIETSGTPQYDQTRAFYTQHGYATVARVPDYFADGDDMVLFHKDLRR